MGTHDPIRLYQIFPHYLIKGRIFGGKNIGHLMCILIFSTTFVSKVYITKINSSKCYHKWTQVFMSSTY